MPVSGMSDIQQSLYQTPAKAKEMLGMRLCVLHNLYFYNHLMEEIRGAIDEHRYKEFKKTTLEGFLTPEEEYR